MKFAVAHFIPCLYVHKCNIISYY